MKCCALLAPLLPSCLSAEKQKMLTPSLEGKLCGKLLDYESFPVRNRENTYEGRARNLGGILLRLYDAAEGRPCCEGVSSKVQTTTGRWGISF